MKILITLLTYLNKNLIINVKKIIYLFSYQPYVLSLG
jgi:hypothetical protein